MSTDENVLDAKAVKSIYKKARETILAQESVQEHLRHCEDELVRAASEGNCDINLAMPNLVVARLIHEILTKRGFKVHMTTHSLHVSWGF